MNTLREIAKLYSSGKMNDSNDEKGAGGYWDTAVELADSLEIDGVPGIDDQALNEQLMVGFYEVLQKILVRRELYD